MDVSTCNSPHARYRALPLQNIEVADGFWSRLQTLNRAVTIPDGYEKLERAGNFANLRRAAGWSDEPYRGPVFMDEDVYKWLEAVSQEIRRTGDAELVKLAAETIALLAAAQQEDGYLNSYYQVAEPGRRWTDLDHGHEMYCAGHLIQAAVAHHRATGSSALLDIARRMADHIAGTFGPGRREGTDGHPEIEMALVELYRETGEARYLKLAEFLVNQRGKGRMVGLGPYGPEYHQDRVPVREAQQVEGHAVRQVYLGAGVTDIYMETGEQALLDAMLRLAHDATTHKMYITGGYGSRFEGESFGDPYELPSDRCYCETCAAIGAMLWYWRLLLAGGDGRFADHIERTLYNGFLSGLAQDGQHYFYINALQSRIGAERPGWHSVACCPPNIVRQIATVGHYIATQDDSGVQIHQYISSTLRAGSERDARTLRLETDYPWRGLVRLTVEETGATPWELSLRIPGWCHDTRLSVNGEAVEPVRPGTYTSIERVWSPGDVVELELAITPAWVQPHPRVDAVRSSVAITRGPLVYCLEETDHPGGIDLQDVRADVSVPLTERWQEDLLGGVMLVEAQGLVEDAAAWGDDLYRPLGADSASRTSLTLKAIPYYAWANRGPAGMRVWVPRAER